MRKVLRFACLGIFLFASCKQEIPSGVNSGKGGGLSNSDLDQIVDDLRRDICVVAWVINEKHGGSSYSYFQVALSRGRNPLDDAVVRINGQYLDSPYHAYDSSFAYYHKRADDPGVCEFSLNMKAPNDAVVTGALELRGYAEILSPPDHYDHVQDSALAVTWTPVSGINYYKLKVTRNSVEVHSSSFLPSATSDYTVPDNVFEYGCHCIYVYGYKGLPVDTDSTSLPRSPSDKIHGASGCFVGILKSYVVVNVY